MSDAATPAGATTGHSPRRTGARRTRSRVVRAAGSLAVVVFALTAVVALATDNLHPRGKGEALATVGGSFGPVGVSTPGLGSGGAGGLATGAGSSAAGASPASGVPQTGAGSVTGPASGGSATGGRSSGGAGSSPSTGGTGSPGGGATPTTSAGSPSVAVASGLLDITAFGSNIGLPLLCNVAIGSLGPVLTNPAVSDVAAAVTSSCVADGTSGSVALLALNSKLAALAVANPALDPAITGLADAFNSAGSQSGVPFASSLIAMSNIIAFFVG